jgi:hypothetical protein
VDCLPNKPGEPHFLQQVFFVPRLAKGLAHPLSTFAPTFIFTRGLTKSSTDFLSAASRHGAVRQTSPSHRLPSKQALNLGAHNFAHAQVVEGFIYMHCNKWCTRGSIKQWCGLTTWVTKLIINKKKILIRTLMVDLLST